MLKPRVPGDRGSLPGGFSGSMLTNADRPLKTFKVSSQPVTRCFHLYSQLQEELLLLLT